MTRPRSQNRQDFIHAATQLFWRRGFGGTSIGDLVEHTGVGRGGIYSDFGGKGEVFEACLQHYVDWAISPVFEPVTHENADLAAIEAFFAAQLAAILEAGLPAKGCLVGNTLLELDQCSAEARELVRAHFRKLTEGFVRAIDNEARRRKVTPAVTAEDLGAQLTLAWHGLLAYSRSCTDPEELQQRGQGLTAQLRCLLGDRD